MKRYLTVSSICWAMIFSILSEGCKKMVQVDLPTNAVTYATAFSDDKTATASLNGLYSNMVSKSQYFGSYGFTLYTGLSGDELINNKPSSNEDPFRECDLQPTSGILNNIWNFGYNNIYHANDCIEGLSSASNLTIGVRSQLLGEAKFLRAFYYYYLCNLFGDVPLVTTTDYYKNQRLPRTSTENIYRQMLADLTSAFKLFSIDNGSGHLRPNKYASAALMSKIYLYMKDWVNAEKYASEVIESGLYRLETDPDNVFLKSSRETIWALDPTGLSYNTYEGRQFNPASGSAIPSYSLGDNLVQSFQENDRRKLSWIGLNNVNNQTYYYPHKYKVRTGSAVSEEPVYVRLAEVILIRSEARIHLGNSEGAKEDLNAIRQRAGLEDIQTTSTATLLLDIYEERRKELFCEMGNRWFDLKRTGRALSVLSEEKADITSEDLLYPVPYDQIMLNQALTQNEGY